MRTFSVLCVALALAGCPQKKDKNEPPPTPVTKAAPAPAVGGLPADAAYQSGEVEAAVLDLQTLIDVPGLADADKLDEQLKQAQLDSALTQSMAIADERGRLVFTTKDSYMPPGTELRYHPARKRYVLADPKTRRYWVMGGGELGNLLEGGPALTRKGYTVEIKDHPDKATMAGFEARRSEATIGFTWTVKLKKASKSGKVAVRLTIWHTDDARLKPVWGQMMIDFLTLPFQDAGGQKVVDALKSKIRFPVQWTMDVTGAGEGDKKQKQTGQAERSRFTTSARSLQIKRVRRADLAYPPAGFKPASDPYRFGEGGQTASPELLAKVPAKPGKPPKDVEPPTEDK